MQKTIQASHFFWEWFLRNQSEFDQLTDSEQPFWDLALDQLHRVDERLWLELSRPDGTDRELIVTAQGNREAFPVAETLISFAPTVRGWRFQALKPPMGFGFTTKYEGLSFDPQEMWFLPLESRTRPHEIGLRVGIPALKSQDADDAYPAVLMILETALGERSVALEIQHVEVAPLPPEPEALGYIELRELPPYLIWKKRKLGLSPQPTAS